MQSILENLRNQSVKSIVLAILFSLIPFLPGILFLGAFQMIVVLLIYQTFTVLGIAMLFVHTKGLTNGAFAGFAMLLFLIYMNIINLLMAGFSLKVITQTMHGGFQNSGFLLFSYVSYIIAGATLGYFRKS